MCAMVTLEFLKREGFSLYRKPVSAMLKLDKSYLYLERKEDGWIIGHSIDGHSFFLRPGGSSSYQYIQTEEELKLEIRFLENNSALDAIELSRGLLLAKATEKVKTEL